MKQFEHIKLKFPTLQRIDSNESRSYVTENGTICESVTSFLARCLKDQKKSLEAWKNLVGKEEADRIAGMGRTRGKYLHSKIEDLLHNRPSETKNPIIDELFNGGKKLIQNNIDKICGIECMLYSNKLGLAGTADCIAYWDGKLSIIDWKTARKRPKDEKYVYSYFLQATIYAMMFKELFKIPIKQIVIFQFIDEEPKNPNVYVIPADKYIGDVEKLVVDSRRVID